MREKVDLSTQQATAQFVRPEASSLPFVTIVMPIRNEASFIERSLNAVLAQDYPRERMEVIVVDGMSDDGTQRVVRQTISPQDASGRTLPIVLLENPSRIVPNALNIALRRARGDVIIRVDGHCEISPDYVRRCIEVLNETDAECVGGPMSTVGESWMARAIAVAQSSWFGVGDVGFRTGRKSPSYVDTLAFGAYRRDVFGRIGGFDEELVRNQDDEFNYRLARSGGKIWMDPSIRSLYYSRSSLARLWRQYFQYGYWKVRVFQKHIYQMRWRHFMPPAFVIALLSGVLLMPFSTAIRGLWVIIVGPYVLANLMASIWIAFRVGWCYLALVPAVFVTLHVSYGLGFLVGLVKFVGRWGEKRDEVAVMQHSPVEVDTCSPRH